jgi:hypothetical protein
MYLAGRITHSLKPIGSKLNKNMLTAISSNVKGVRFARLNFCALPTSPVTQSLHQRVSDAHEGKVVSGLILERSYCSAHYFQVDNQCKATSLGWRRPMNGQHDDGRRTSK